MQFACAEGRVIAAEITGPTHNLLRLILTEHAMGKSTSVVDLSISTTPKSLNSTKVLCAVLDGVDEANKHCGSHCTVELIEYLSEDTQQWDNYKRLAFELVKRVMLMDGRTVQEKVGQFCRSYG